MADKYLQDDIARQRDAMGRISETIVFDRVLTYEERRMVNVYLCAKYGIIIPNEFTSYLAEKAIKKMFKCIDKQREFCDRMIETIAGLLLLNVGIGTIIGCAGFIKFLIG